MDELLKKEENRYCMDCKKKSVNWISVNLGIFLCIRCAGIHRSLGTHISFVRSLTLDNITENEYKIMKEIGNKNAKNMYEANVPSYIFIPNEFSEFTQIEKWIRDKYVYHLYKKKENNQVNTLKLPLELFKKNSEPSNLLQINSEKTDLLKFDSEPSNLLQINSEKSDLLKFDSEQPDLLQIDSEKSDLLKFDSEQDLNDFFKLKISNDELFLKMIM